MKVLAPKIGTVVTWALMPGPALIVEAIEFASKAVSAAADKGIAELQAEVAKQEIRLKFDLQQAKVAQELAIAQRIADAETVEIEEFYDSSGKAGLGAQAKGDVISIGLAAEGTRVNKRIYTFKGRLVRFDEQ